MDTFLRAPMGWDTFLLIPGLFAHPFLWITFSFTVFLRELRFSEVTLVGPPKPPPPMLASFLFISISLSTTGFLKIWRNAGLLYSQDLWPLAYQSSRGLTKFIVQITGAGVIFEIKNIITSLPFLLVLAMLSPTPVHPQIHWGWGVSINFMNTQMQNLG